MKINSTRLEALLIEMQSGLRSGAFDDDATYVTMCILEQNGIQIQVKVTCDPHEFMSFVTSGVVEFDSHACQGISDL
ncbi:hypothetical protein ACMYR3_17070 (plasmid) [Ampullimonas aquatilis]|uniref:hypothetical protein n=1 Tax=Ampullimonas aquatilis TaxID=1341549 RepID=UPI003C76D9E7